MAKQIIVNVIQTDEAVHPASFRKSIETDNTMVRRESNPALGIVASVLYGGKRYYVTDSLESIVAASGGELIQATVNLIDNTIFNAVAHAFPSADINIRSVTSKGATINAGIEFNKQVYYVLETIDALLGAANFSSVGAGTPRTAANLVIQSYQQSKTNNPHYNLVMTLPPTVTTPGGGAPTAGLANIYSATASNVIDLTQPFQYFGGDISVFANQYVRLWASTVKSSGNVDTLLNGYAWRIPFTTDAPIISIGFLTGNSYRFIVDGQYVSLTPTAPAGGGTGYITLDFTSAGGRKIRNIEVEGWAAGAFVGVAVSYKDKVWKTPVPNVSMVVLGDSYTEGAGTTYVPDGLARVAGDFLGIKNVRMSGQGGTGYTATNSSAAYSFIQRVQDVTTKAPSIVMILGGINDADDTLIQPAALLLFQTIRAALPNAIILVGGAFAGATGPSAAIISKNNKIKAAYTAWADPNSAFLDISPNATQNGNSYVTGTGWANSLQSNGNADVVIGGSDGNDSTHPTAPGHLYLGERLALDIANALKLFL